MTRGNNVFITVMAILAVANTSYVQAFSQNEAAEIFKTYDVEEEDSPDCLDDGFDEEYCPKDEKVNCGDISGIKAHCVEVLGDFAVEELPKDTGVNALEGCIRYVGYHVFDDDHIACCPSDFCEDWIDEQFDSMEMDDDDEYNPYYEDDDDDDEIDDDDDEF